MRGVYRAKGMWIFIQALYILGQLCKQDSSFFCQHLSFGNRELGLSWLGKKGSIVQREMQTSPNVNS
jgi:hypothetical protein